jgi:hypothetical protein
MRHAATLSLVLVMLSLPACRNEQHATTTSTNAPVAAVTAPALSPEQLGDLGAQIARDPAHANDLLAQNHLTREQFEKAIRGVTESADASKRYTAAYKKSSA